MNPLISILIPAYQAEKTISRCLDSALSQSCDNYEIVVIDDGSTDSTLSICGMYCNNERVRLYTQENKGIAFTRQRLVELAKGRYLQFVDADDWIESDLVELHSKILSEKDCDIIISDFILEKLNSSKYRAQMPTSLTTDALITDISSPKLLGVLWNKLVKKELFEGLKFPNLRYCEDWSICVQLFMRASSFYYVGRALYHYDNIIVSNSLTREINADTFKSRIEYIDYLKSIQFDRYYVKEFNSQVSNIAYASVINGIYNKEQFDDSFGNIPFWDTYNKCIKRCILVIARYLSLSLARQIYLFFKKIA